MTASPGVVLVRCRRCAGVLRLPVADPRCPRARDALDRALAALGWRGRACPACAESLADQGVAPS